MSDDSHAHLLLCSACARIAVSLPIDELTRLARRGATIVPATDGGELICCQRCDDTIAYRADFGTLDIGVRDDA